MTIRNESCSHLRKQTASFINSTKIMESLCVLDTVLGPKTKNLLLSFSAGDEDLHLENIYIYVRQQNG